MRSFQIVISFLLLLQIQGILGSFLSRGKRLFSLFNVVKFANDPCLATDSKNGTCYTAQECSQKGGSNAGTCAAGYGTCCTFSLTCGEKSSENNTYFQSSANGFGVCTIEVCPCNSNICSLRLDFSTFVISGPATSTTTIGRTTSGIRTPATSGFATASSSITTMGQCLDDQFFVTNPGGYAPPILCGINTGAHVYVDSSPGCNKVGFAIGQATAARQWDIKITQLSCNSDNLPPEGCTQYHFGSATGTLKSFNFDGNLHLANQNQNICIRRERGMCRICYSAADNEFDVSSDSAINVGLVGGASNCCAYGSDGRGMKGYDCVIIPTATKKGTTDSLIPGNADEFCGRALATVTNGPSATICSQRYPFQVRFLTDTYEFENEAKQNPNGFRIIYEMLPCV